MKCDWIIRKGEVRQKDVSARFRKELVDAHAQLKADRDDMVTAARMRIERPTDEDVIAAPVVASLNQEYYENTLKGYAEAERIETARKEAKIRTLGQIGGIVAGGALTLLGMAFLDSCEKREDAPTQPMRHPGARFLGRF